MEKRISGRTKLMALFGTPVGHSGSPSMYNFSFQHDNLDYAYMAFNVDTEQMPKAMEAVRELDIKGGNFTTPVKNIAAELVDKLSPAAEMVGACNTFVNDNGIITGHVTDGVGFIENLRINGVEVKDRKILVLGAGGAGTAIQVQLAIEGAKEIRIFNIKDDFFGRAEKTKDRIVERYPECIVTVDDLNDKIKLAEAINSCDIVINATTVGMKPNDNESLVDKSLFREDLIVADTVYDPEKTKMILDAEEVGCKTISGRGMLLLQGAVNYEIFVGKKMPLDEYLRFQNGDGK